MTYPYPEAYRTTQALTSAEVERARFGEVRRGGLNRLEVYAFLRRVTQTMRGVEYRREAEWRMVDMLWEAQKTLEAARRKAAQYGAPGGTSPDPEARAAVPDLEALAGAIVRRIFTSLATAAPGLNGQDLVPGDDGRAAGGE